MNRLRFASVALSLSLLAGCGGGSKAMLPVDSPIKKWEAPTEEELGDTGAKAEGDGWDDEEEAAPAEKKAPDGE